MMTSLRRASPGHEIRPSRLARLAAGIILLLALAGCEPVQMRAPGAPTDTEAQRLAERGRHQAAADAFLRLALETEGPVQQKYLILVANERRLAGNPEVAQTILGRLGEPIDESNLLLWCQVAAEVAIVMGNPVQAIGALDRAPETTDTDVANNLLLIRSKALFRLGKPVDATRALLNRDIWLEDRAAISANQHLLWDNYQNWGMGLQPDANWEGYDTILRGWLELGFIAWSQRTNSMGMRSALMDWQGAYPSHPASDILLPDILGGIQSVQQFPAQVALLLPMSSRQGASATAVRDGFLAAHFASAGQPNRPIVKVYDVNGFDVAEIYAQAVNDGADFVVGPLLKDSVERLAVSGIMTPTLALNFLPGKQSVSRYFYQFSLSPEDEARQVAQRAAALGQYRALALAPDNEWGRRLLSSFTDEMEKQGGRILRYSLFDPNSPDFSASIENLLLIDESRARKDRLNANLGARFEYEPRRRTDIDLIFLAANEKAGKQIRPQLRFHYAGSIPTYSTSAIYQEGSRNNSDINGIMFPDIPWIIAPDGQSVEVRRTLSEYWPEQSQRRARLYALGFDAYRLMPLINAGLGPDEMQGMTGVLHMDRRRRILRRLPWARMQKGQPKLMEFAPTRTASPGVARLAQ
jgi:outer membrane PBP1 activator LpoA protein